MRPGFDAKSSAKARRESGQDSKLRVTNKSQTQISQTRIKPRFEAKRQTRMKLGFDAKSYSKHETRNKLGIEAKSHRQ